jgi:two-component system, NtrC family, response regulator AtoC
MTAFVNPNVPDLPDGAPASGNDQKKSGVAHEGIGREERPTEAPAGNESNGSEFLGRFIGRSESVLWMKRFIEKVAPSEMSVLIGGPSGVGKALVAEIIHSLSRRSSGPFIMVNCASIPEDIFELELFGAEKSLLKGVEEEVPGKIEAARGGTLFFNKIGDMPLKVQGRVLSFVENKEIEKPGARAPFPVDVRILATTNRNLADLINQGRFREDLYYRLNILSIQVPPLRDRLEDLPDLIRHLLGRINSRVATHISNISSGALGVLNSHEWPGNLRELRNVLERAAILSDGSTISEQDARTALRETFGGPPSTPPPALDQNRVRLGEKVNLKETLHEVEKKLILEALGKTGGVQTDAAGMLGLTPKNLWKKMQKHEIKAKLKAHRS